ncbi:class I SAM-dependent methyltransferase [Kribbella sp. NBC_01505]|uniref:class I SAM-dependent methyltransferase n=1 Tax=Kribbella sp. NBC_01505 TaxID=2903580 RepID=UPI0038654CCB
MSTDWNLLEVAESYEDYEPVRERAFAWAALFEQAGLAEPGCRTVLDYGAGTGRVAAEILRGHDVSVIAADRSPSMLKVARSKRQDPRISYQVIGDDQRLELPDDGIDAAISSFVFVCIPDAEIIQNIVSEVYRVLRPGATYAVLDVNPDSIGVPFEIGRYGEAGRAYAAGEAIEMRLARPGAEPVSLVDYHWPKDAQLDRLRAAGFREVGLVEPTLPADYGGPDQDRMPVERTSPPYVIYVARK